MTTMPDVRGHASEEGYEDEEEDDEEEKAGVIRTVETFDIDDRGEVKVVAQQPRGLRQQACAVIRLSLPVVGQYILQFLNFSIPFLFLGRLSPEAMGAFALGQMFINCTANALGYGFVTALDTIASQAWGSKNFPLVGLATQRSVLIMTLFCFPFVGIWLFIPSRLFPIVGVSPSVTRLVSLHCSIMLVGIWPSFMYEIQKKYLANQGVTLPPVVVMIPALGLNLLCNWLLINRFGFIGAPISISVSAWTMCIMLFVYIRWSRLHVKTWPKGGFLNTGWDWKCLTGWYEMFKLGIPGALMLMLEWGIFEINSFFAARLGSVLSSAPYEPMNDCNHLKGSPCYSQCSFANGRASIHGTLRVVSSYYDTCWECSGRRRCEVSPKTRVGSLCNGICVDAGARLDRMLRMSECLAYAFHY